MAKSKTNPKVDWYFVKNKKWIEEIEMLRNIALECGLDEELKWGCPCYAHDGSNIVLIHIFKEYCAYLFFRGVLLKDPKGVLIQQTKNVQSARQIRFANVKEIVKMKSTLKAYIKEAIAVEKAGLKVEFKKTKEFEMPEEFQNKLNKNSPLKTAFYALTPGRQRGYLLYFSSAKQSATREARIEKYTKQILKGKGLDD
ncbi:MAG TPA: YdeI/OmpD-associated family protein [Bacteroidia bacterium]|jgi:uncharacterized protein YdeI (YjbR/CyaY-like superfamily)|nr:YdeI/OmpD-associated family protein [Bacteroidia bacterium]